MRALRIPTEPEEPITVLEVHQLEDYQAAVGGWIEPVDIPELGITIYVHEEGLVRGLPFNSRATFLWWYFVPQARQKAMLAGPALIVGVPDRNGDSTDVPTEVEERFLNPGKWCVDVKRHGEVDWIQIPASYTDYFEALVWAMVGRERWTTAEGIRVVPVATDELSGDADMPHEPTA